MSEPVLKPRPGILDISAYVPGESPLAPGKRPVKLSSNESPLGASPAAIAAYTEAASSLERYPDGASGQLRKAIADAYGLNAERIVCGAGSDEVLALLARAYLGPGDEGIFTEHGFLVYKIAILACGATPVVVKERDYTTDVDAILAAVTPRTRMVFLANPNNPTGTYIPTSEVKRLRAGLPKNVLLILDAAYCEYVRRNDYDSGLELVATSENTVMTRTMSKIHGLAALRIGWVYAPAAVADVLNRIRGPFNVSAPAIAAGAASLADKAHLEAAARHNEIWLPKVSERLTALGLKVTPSVGNFILIHFPASGATAAKADEHLKREGIALRRVGAYGLPNSLRMTIGSREDNEAVIAALTEFMREAGASGGRTQ